MVWEGEERKGDGVLRYVFLFKSKLMLTERIDPEDPDDPPDFKHIATIRVRHSFIVRCVRSTEGQYLFSSTSTMSRRTTLMRTCSL